MIAFDTFFSSIRHISRGYSKLIGPEWLMLFIVLLLTFARFTMWIMAIHFSENVR